MSCSDEEFEKPTRRAHSIWRLFQIAFAFATVFFPLVFVATLLCLFVTIAAWTIQDPPEENANLPIDPHDESFLTTTVLINKVALTSSFASNVAQWAAVPFLLLYSFLVALELSNRHEVIDQDMKKLLHGDQTFLLNWTVLRLWRARKTKIATGTRIAGIGAFLCVILTYDHDAFPPCTINGSSKPWTLLDTPSAYRVLATGLLNQTEEYNNEDFNTLNVASDAGAFIYTQLVTHIDDVTNEQHVLYFNPWSAEEYSDSPKVSKLDLTNQDVERVGIDYVAETISVVTECTAITTDCGIYNTTSDASSIPYHCSNGFYGDLNEIPANGLERLKGWNTTFFDFHNDPSLNVSIASQLNPFSYNVTAVVDSIDLDDLILYGDPQVLQGIVVEIGDGRVGFAMSCNSTVYDVTYSLVNGSILVFNTTLAAPSTAAMIKAPLQAGFGSYELFEKAAMSVLLSHSTILDAMELAFSQTFLALVAGVYDPAPFIEKRWRYDMTVTKIRKAPFYFLVVCMFMYSIVVLVFTLIALSLFRRSDVRALHSQLMS
ncbi:hypothetical protein CUC08_Gglean001469 [Alternaria sp. MG1]|nr:hypothetical protein CUC08_Gglean001469 [Alternaria sp. MG1]